MAYFQPATNTYAPVDRLAEFYRQAVAHPKVVALAIGTRPDCVPDDVLDLLQATARQIPLSVEFGMQTMHDRSLDWMNRGHHHEATIDAIARSRGRGFEIGVHLILGLPGESAEQMLATAREAARLAADSVKIHNLYAVRRTRLGEDVLAGRVALMPQEAYVRTLADLLEILPPTTIVERVSGDAPDDFFIGPQWCLNKQAVLKALQDELERRDTWQGRLYSPPA